MDKRFEQTRNYAEAARRAADDAERMMQAEQARLANSGRLFPVHSTELGHAVTRYEGDIAAFFEPFTAGTTWRGKVLRPRGGR